MNEDKKFNMNRNLLQHFDEAVNDSDSSFKDSVEFEKISNIAERYSDKKFLCEGGMKKIFSCSDNFTSRKVAYAEPKENASIESVDAFIKEAEITAKLQHPYIVPVYELSTDGKRPFFTMKLLGGQNLGDAIKSKNFTQDQKLEVFLKICDAVSYAHSRSVLHLDLKPENIQLDEYGDVLLCDWGLACDLNNQNKSATRGGTPGFMAPEQYTETTFSRTADTYSLGALLYILLTDHIAVDGTSSDEIKENTLKGKVISPQLRSGSEKLHRSLIAIIKKALELKPEDRYQNAEELAQEVKNYMNGFATKAEEASLLTLLFLIFKRYKALCTTIIFFIVTLTVLTSVFISNLNSEKQNALLAKTAAENAEQESMEIRVNTAPELVKLAKREYKLKEYDKALNKVDLALTLDPNNKQAQFFKARFLVGAHDFSEAETIIKVYKGQGNKEGLKKVIDQIKVFKNDGILIDHPQLPSLIKSMKGIKGAPGLRMHFLISCTLKYPLENRWRFAEKYLKSISHENFTFEKTKNGSFYNIKATNNSGMYDISVLSNLPINKLDVSGSPVNEIATVANLPLEELNISGTNVFEVSPLLDTKLKVLNINKTNVRHLHQITDLPLEELYLNDKWIDYNVLLEFKKLKKITAHKGILGPKAIEALRERMEVKFY